MDEVRRIVSQPLEDAEPSVLALVGWGALGGAVWAVVGEVLPALSRQVLVMTPGSVAGLWGAGLLGGSIAGAAGGLLLALGSRNLSTWQRGVWLGGGSAAVLGTALAAAVRVEPYEVLVSPLWPLLMLAAVWVGLARPLGRLSGVVALLPLGAWLAVASGQLAAPPRGEPLADSPSLLLVTIDGLRGDLIDGPGRDAPTLRQLALEGQVWTQATSPSPDGAVAAASLLFGAAPQDVGISASRGALARRRGLASQLRDHGWQTGAFVSSRALSRGRGFGEGFSTYDDDFRLLRALSVTTAGRMVAGLRPPPRERRADATGALASTWIATAEQPWFAWVHLHDPAGPYTPPPPFDYKFYDGSNAGRGPAELPDGVPPEQLEAIEGPPSVELLRARYRGEVAFVDEALRRLLDELHREGLANNTVVAVVGTYGESLGEDGVWFRHDALTEATLRVPLVIYFPDQLAAERHTAPVQLQGLAPALVDLLLGRSDALAALDRQGVAHAVLAGDGRRPAQAYLRGKRVAYRLIGGASPQEQAWKLDGESPRPIVLDEERGAMLRSEAQALLDALR